MPDVQPLLRFGITIDDLWPLVVVDPAVLQHALNFVEQKYGSVLGYLQERAGVDAEIIGRLQQVLLHE